MQDRGSSKVGNPSNWVPDDGGKTLKDCIDEMAKMQQLEMQQLEMQQLGRVINQIKLQKINKINEDYERCLGLKI